MGTRTKRDDFDSKLQNTIKGKPKTELEAPAFLNDKDLWVIMASALIAPAVGFI